jgi:hypothetical protein
MPNDARELPAANDGLYRFLGGSPLTVAVRLILLSILVGVVLAAIGFDPWNIVNSIRRLFPARRGDRGTDLADLAAVRRTARTIAFPGVGHSRCNCDLSAAATRSGPAAGSTPAFMSQA